MPDPGSGTQLGEDGREGKTQHLPRTLSTLPLDSAASCFGIEHICSQTDVCACPQMLACPTHSVHLSVGLPQPLLEVNEHPVYRTTLERMQRFFGILYENW